MELKERLDELQEQNSEMFNTIALQEQQIEKMRNCDNCKHDCKLLIAHFGGCDFMGKKEKWELKNDR